MKYKYGLLLVTAVAGGVYLSLRYVNPFGEAISLSEMILQLSGSRGSFALGFSYPELVTFAMKLLPAFLFEAYAGIMLYRHFCTASIYVFSRCPQRMKWYAGEACRLGVAACIFHILLLLTVIVTTMCRYELQIDRGGMMLVVYHFFIHTLWMYIMTLAVNLTAVYSGSSIAYALVIGVQMVCIILLNIADLLVRHFGDTLSYERLLPWNPVARLVLGWHGSEASIMNQELSSSLILFLLIGAAITFTGAVIIKKHDFLVADLETERA